MSRLAAVRVHAPADAERAVAALCRSTMAIYRAYRGIGMYHPASSDTRVLPWPTASEVPGVGALGERAYQIEVMLSAASDDRSDGRSAADTLYVTFYTRTGHEPVLTVERSHQDTLDLGGPLDDDIGELLPVLRWACRQAVKGSL